MDNCTNPYLHESTTLCKVHTCSEDECIGLVTVGTLCFFHNNPSTWNTVESSESSDDEISTGSGALTDSKHVQLATAPEYSNDLNVDGPI